jgi:hypothetical protein
MNPAFTGTDCAHGLLGSEQEPLLKSCKVGHFWGFCPFTCDAVIAFAYVSNSSSCHSMFLPNASAQFKMST